MSVAMMAMVLGAASGAFKAAGTIAGGIPTGYEGLSAGMEAASKRMQANAGESNARLSNLYLDYQIKTQQRDYRQEGKHDFASANFTGRLLDRKADADFATGQQDMFEVQRDTEQVASSFQSKAAASGFIATEGDLGTEAEEIDKRGIYLSGRARYGAETARNTSRTQADAIRAEGKYALDSSIYQSKVTGGYGRLQAMMNRMTAGRQASALRFEAGGLDMAQRAAQSAAKKKQMMSYISAGSTLLGGAGTAYTDYKELPK